MVSLGVTVPRNFGEKFCCCWNSLFDLELLFRSALVRLALEILVHLRRLRFDCENIRLE